MDNPSDFLDVSCDYCEHSATVIVVDDRPNRKGPHEQKLCTCCFRERDELASGIIELFANGFLARMFGGPIDYEALRKAQAAPFN